MQHHEVFSHFKPFSGIASENYQSDFLGATTSHRFVAGLRCTGGHTVTDYPDPDEEYFQWVDLLESVVAARGSYTMLDLGAGFGRWSVRAAYAIRQFNPGLPYYLTAVEAEPVRYEWMRTHFGHNGIDASQHRLIHAAVSDTPGEVLFYVGGPRGGPFDCTPDHWYGHSLTKDYDVSSQSKRDGKYHGFKVTCHKSGWRSIRVPSVSLRDLLKDLRRVDFIDVDIEREELPAIRSAIEELDAKVKRLHIGTHGKEIEDQLRQLLSAHGWRCLADYSLFSKSETPWGTISFENGVQSWVNPRLTD